MAEQIKKHRVKTLLILGDLTDAKDNHSAELVNRIVMAINSLPITDIRIMAGNHDWLRKGHEFFKFLNLIPAVQFITHLTQDRNGDAQVLYLPYSKQPAAEWADIKERFHDFDYIFMHQTIAGARASNGQIMDGEGLPDFTAIGKKCAIYSGDIHVPQRIGGLTYVGSPYHVHFGDAFKPRCLLLEESGKTTDLHFKTIARVVVNVSSLHELQKQDLRKGDQVKVRVRLPESEKHEWAATKRAITHHLLESGVEVHGVELSLAKSTRRHLVGEHKGQAHLTPQESILRFVEHESLSPSAFDAAMDILES